MAKNSLLDQSVEFLSYLEEWLTSLPVLEFSKVVQDPARVAIVSVDVINGFCSIGPLASSRVGRIAAPIARLFERAWGMGVRNILLTQDTHEPDAIEFAQFPPHCIRGTEESQPVAEFKALSFFEHLLQIPKNSIHSGIQTGFSEWVENHPEVDSYLVVGDCTDLCTYQLAMQLRLDANARQIKRRVIAVVEGIDTYDRPVSAARAEGGLPHPADLLHGVFLYHMALNGVEVVEMIM